MNAFLLVLVSIFSMKIVADLPVASVDSFYDKKGHFRQFDGRLTDKDMYGNTIKIATENPNIKFLKASDPLRIKIASYPNRRACKGHVRSIEKGYIVAFIVNVRECWPSEYKFRRGAQLTIYCDKLKERVINASEYRHVLLKKREDYLGQLNRNNNFLWTFEEKLLALNADYDKRIAEIKRLKQIDMKKLQKKKKEVVDIRGLLMQKLNEVDRDIEYYRILPYEPLQDRWSMDHDLGLPVEKMPSRLKTRRKRSMGFNL